jgi:hypothetical protein
MDKLVSTYGTFTEWDDHIVWYAEVGYVCDGDDAADMLWDLYCDVAEEIQPLLGNEYEITDTWADNDSTGFKIRRKNG